MDKLRHLTKRYAALWRSRPGATLLLHAAVAGGVACAALLARDERAGLAATLALLAVLLALTPVCAAMDEIHG